MLSSCTLLLSPFTVLGHSAGALLALALTLLTDIFLQGYEDVRM